MNSSGVSNEKKTEYQLNETERERGREKDSTLIAKGFTSFLSFSSFFLLQYLPDACDVLKVVSVSTRSSPLCTARYAETQSTAEAC